MNIKNKKTNRIISFLLVFCMIFSMIPNIFAADSTPILFSVEKIWDEEYGILSPYETTFEIYGTNEVDDTENGEFITSIRLRVWNIDDNNPNRFYGYVEATSPEYLYYYVKESFKTSIDAEFVHTQSFSVVDPSSEEYANIIAEAEPSTTENLKVVQITSLGEAVEKTHNVTVDYYWQDEEASFRPDSIEVTLWGASDFYSKDSAKLLKTFTLSNENAYNDDLNHWQTQLEVTTPYPYFFIESNIEGINGEKYSFVEGEMIKEENNVSLVASGYLGYMHKFSYVKEWNDIDPSLRPVIIYNIYGTNTPPDDEGNYSDGEHVHSIYVTGSNESRYWSKDEVTFLNKEYKFYYAEEVMSGETASQYVLTSNYTSCGNSNGYKYVQTSMINTSKMNSSLNIKVNWIDSGNTRPSETILEVYQSEGSYNGNKIAEIIMSTDTDLNLDDDPNTWEYSLPVEGLATEDYFTIKKQTSDNYVLEDTDSTKKDSIFVINATNTFAEYKHQLTITHNWEDNNNAANERPDSITYNIYGAYGENSWNKYNDVIGTVTLTKDNVVEGNSNQWQLTTDIITKPYEYIHLKACNTDNKKYNIETDNDNFVKVEDVMTSTVESTAKYGYRHHIYIGSDIYDMDNEQNRPESVTLKIYGTHEENDTTNGTLIYEETMLPNFSGSVDLFLEEEFEYIYATAEITGAEIDAGTFEIMDIRTREEDYYYEEYGYRYFEVVVELSLTTEINFGISTIWNDSDAKEGTRPESITIDFYGSNYNYEEKVLFKSITLNSNGTDTWTKQELLNIGYPYWDVKVSFNNDYYYLDPEININQIEENKFEIKIINTYKEQNKVIDFNITKTWDDDSNKYNERPESFTVEIYGTYDKNDTENGELIKTQIISINDDLNTDNNPNTWEYKIEDVNSKYNYFYIKEIINNEDIEGTYTLTSNTITEEEIPNSVIVNVNESTPEPNFIDNLLDNLSIRPFADHEYHLSIKKLWDDNNNKNNQRPEYITLNIYGNTANNEARKKLYATINLYEDHYEIITDNSPYSWGQPQNKWSMSGVTWNGDHYIWIEEKNTSLKDNGYYKPLFNIEYNSYNINLTITNEYIEHPTYNVNLTNTYTPKQRDVQFNIKKVWDDENNKYNFRPESISFRIYGTDVEGATSGGEILDEVVLGDFAQSTTDPNVWEILTGVIETHYDYFYITEIDAGEYYTTTISPINKVEQETNIYPYSINQIEQGSTFAGGYYPGLSLYIDKYWEDNNNAAGKRPNFVDFEVYYSINYTENIDEMDLYAKIRMFEDKSIILEDPLNALGLGEITNDEPFEENQWVCTYPSLKEHIDYNFMVLEVPTSNYYSTIEPFPMSDHGHVFASQTVTNTYYVETYDVTITNTFENPYKNVQFKLNKIWNDQNNKYNLRPYEVEFKLYGTNTEGATSGGELLKTITLNSSNAINANTWSIITEEFETIYDYFYIKETSISGNYTTTISPIEKVDSFTTVINNLQNNSGIAPLSGSEDFIYLYKIWDDNNNEKGKRPESITINAYTDEAKTDLYFSLELTETTCTMLEDPHGIDFYSYGGWSAESIFFGSAPNVPELYIEEICDNYVSSIVVSVENSEEFLGTDTNITITNTYTEDPAELYEVNITNTMTAPERDVQFKINKIWNDYLNKYNSRGPVTINIYGTNTEGATTGGSLVGSFTITEEDFVERNIWSKTSPVFSTTYEYFYLEEVFNGENYTTTISPITKNNKETNVYSSDPEAALALRDYSIIVKNEWEDTDETKRPEFIDFEILYSENTSASISEMELYAKVRVIDNESYIIEDPLGKFTLGRMTKPAWLRDAWAFDLATTDINYVFAIREISPINYYSEIETEITHDGDWTHSVFTVTNNYYAEEYEATVTNSYSGPVEVIFNINKTWDDGNNTANLRPQGIQVQIYGTNTEGATSGGTLIDTVVLTNENVDSTNSNVWNKTVVLDADYPYFYAVELSSIGTELSTYTLTSNTVTKVDNTIQPANKDVYNINLTNKLDSVPLTITKIWKDDNNMYNTRPDSLNITVYQNGRVFDVITFTSANVLGSNNNVWETVINVPKLDENGNEYVYTISEDENCLELGYYYYEPYINQTSLTAINVGIWLPPLDIDIVPSYSITVGKEIINVEGQLATEADFWRMHLNINNTYSFPIVLKQLERTLSRGETGMEENYEGYTGVEIHGVLTNKGQIVFTDLEPGKYEISENINQYFDFISMESILASSGASLTYENGKYYITLSGVTGEHEEITIKVINKLKDERPFNDLEIKENLFKIERDK